MLVRWQNAGMPGRRLATQLGTPETIGGHPSRVLRTPADPSCAALGGQRSINAVIENDVLNSHDHYVEMSACLSGPNTQQAQAAVERMLTSVHLNN